MENSIRPTAVGKKNWLFVGDSQAGQWAAILYTVIESCRRHAIDPFAYSDSQKLYPNSADGGSLGRIVDK